MGPLKKAARFVKSPFPWTPPSPLQLLLLQHSFKAQSAAALLKSSQKGIRGCPSPAHILVAIIWGHLAASPLLPWRLRKIKMDVSRAWRSQHSKLDILLPLTSGAGRLRNVRRSTHSSQRVSEQGNVCSSTLRRGGASQEEEILLLVTGEQYLHLNGLGPWCTSFGTSPDIALICSWFTHFYNLIKYSPFQKHKSCKKGSDDFFLLYQSRWNYLPLNIRPPTLLGFCFGTSMETTVYGSLKTYSVFWEARLLGLFNHFKLLPKPS